ncbi:MAG: hypothetical protein QGH83_15705 [Candidatus Pacebacteria bacterium]|jgi:hypothetical protein|nr:hypothetical protein [Candidatus Paceibacterota bacterium]
MSEETVKCAKCGKEKNKDEGTFMLEGTSFCCKECCGDPQKGEHKESSENTCEFC